MSCQSIRLDSKQVLRLAAPMLLDAIDRERKRHSAKQLPPSRVYEYAP